MVKDTEDKQPQLKCKICEAKRQLTEEEIVESIEIMKRHNMKANQILNMWSALDGDICPEGGNHDYGWNPAFRESIMNDADSRKNNEVLVIKNNNENEELTKACDKLEKETEVGIEKIKQDTEQKIREMVENKDKKINEMQDKIMKNKETNDELGKINPVLEENILKTSGRVWKEWL